MPWTEQRHPPSMQALPPWVRAKAIEIANALLDEGMDEGKAIRIAIAKAKQWAEHHAAGGVRSRMESSPAGTALCTSDMPATLAASKPLTWPRSPGP